MVSQRDCLSFYADRFDIVIEKLGKKWNSFWNLSEKIKLEFLIGIVVGRGRWFRNTSGRSNQLKNAVWDKFLNKSWIFLFKSSSSPVNSFNSCLEVALLHIPVIRGHVSLHPVLWWSFKLINWGEDEKKILRWIIHSWIITAIPNGGRSGRENPPSVVPVYAAEETQEVEWRGAGSQMDQLVRHIISCNSAEAIQIDHRLPANHRRDHDTERSRWNTGRTFIVHIKRPPKSQRHNTGSFDECKSTSGCPGARSFPFSCSVPAAEQ